LAKFPNPYSLKKHDKKKAGSELLEDARCDGEPSIAFPLNPT
jgi:hypothetical protein